ncbi:MAG: hypothetical protein JNK04_14420 [Myxococcales bacterium]|nr:hypothetical protein [Myxococcales bacterium]
MAPPPVSCDERRVRAHRPTPSERVTAFFAWSLPFGLALVRASSHAQWRGDVAAVRDLALAGVGWGGGISTLLAQMAALLPIGSLTFRTAAVSCGALAVAALAIYRISLRMLRASERSLGMIPSVFAAPALAALSTLIATMTPMFQREATVGGSTMLAVALGLSLIERAFATLAGEGGERPMRSMVAWGFLLGSLTAENAVAGLTATLACAGSIASLRFAKDERRLLVPYRVLRSSTVAWLIGALLFSLPGIVRAFAPKSVLDIGGPYIWGPALPPDLTPRPTLLSAWTDEIGWVSLGMAAFGVASVGFSSRTRVLVLPPAVLVASDMLWRSSVGATEGTLSLRFLAIAAMAALSTVGVYAFFNKLVSLKVPLARAGAALVIAFQATLVALIAEQASATANRADELGAESFSVVALDRLPARAVVLADSPIVTWRLLAATLVEGRRPDVMLVPRRLLARGDVSLRLLAREPQVEALLRSVALEGTSDEIGLSELSDVRPLFTEPERGWGQEVYGHLSVSGAWLRFEPEPLTSSDRKVDVEKTLRELRRFIDESASHEADRESAFVASAIVVAHAKTLLKIGDVANGHLFLGEIDAPGTNAVAQSRSLDVLFSSAVARLPAVRNERLKKAAEKKPQRQGVTADRHRTPAPARKR